MKRPIILVALVTLVLSSCKPHRDFANTNASSPKPTEQTLSKSESHKPCVNLNTATEEELKELPGIGEVMARRVIDYREHGRFRRPEEIIIVEGFSEKKYHTIANDICVE